MINMIPVYDETVSKLFDCELCNTKYTHKIELSRHYNKAHKKDKDDFSELEKIKNPEMRKELTLKNAQDDRKKLCCEICLFELVNNAEIYVQHLLENHTGSDIKDKVQVEFILELLKNYTNFKCEICNESVEANRRDYIDHILEKHYDSMGYKVLKYLKDYRVKYEVLRKTKEENKTEMKIEKQDENNRENEEDFFTKEEKAGKIRCDCCISLIEPCVELYLAHLIEDNMDMNEVYKEMKNEQIKNLMDELELVEKSICEICDKNLSTRYEYEDHVANEHSELGLELLNKIKSPLIIVQVFERIIRKNNGTLKADGDSLMVDARDRPVFLPDDDTVEAFLKEKYPFLYKNNEYIGADMLNSHDIQKYDSYKFNSNIQNFSYSNPMNYKNNNFMSYSNQMIQGNNKFSNFNNVNNPNKDNLSNFNINDPLKDEDFPDLNIDDPLKDEDFTDLMINDPPDDPLKNEKFTDLLINDLPDDPLKNENFTDINLNDDMNKNLSNQLDSMIKFDKPLSNNKKLLGDILSNTLNQIGNGKKDKEKEEVFIDTKNDANIKRLCDIPNCANECEISYEIYAIHLKYEHTEAEWSKYISDPNLLEVMKTGREVEIICAICNKLINSAQIEEYIRHIRKFHVSLLNSNELNKYINDKYVLSVLLGKSVYGVKSVESNEIKADNIIKDIDDDLIPNKKLLFKDIKNDKSDSKGTINNEINIIENFNEKKSKNKMMVDNEINITGDNHSENKSNNKMVIDNEFKIPDSINENKSNHKMVISNVININNSKEEAKSNNKEINISNQSKNEYQSNLTSIDNNIKDNPLDKSSVNTLNINSLSRTELVKKTVQELIDLKEKLLKSENSSLKEKIEEISKLIILKNKGGPKVNSNTITNNKIIENPKSNNSIIDNSSITSLNNSSISKEDIMSSFSSNLNINPIEIRNTNKIDKNKVTDSNIYLTLTPKDMYNYSIDEMIEMNEISNNFKLISVLFKDIVKYSKIIRILNIKNENQLTNFNSLSDFEFEKKIFFSGSLYSDPFQDKNKISFKLDQNKIACFKNQAHIINCSYKNNKGNYFILLILAKFRSNCEIKNDFFYSEISNIYVTNLIEFTV